MRNHMLHCAEIKGATLDSNSNASLQKIQDEVSQDQNNPSIINNGGCR